MRQFVIATTVVGVILAGVARAELKEGDYAPDIEAKEWLNTEDGQPISISDLKGLVVVLYFWVSWHAAGEQLMPLVNQAENMAREHGVFTMGVTEADRARVGDMIKEGRFFFPIALESPSAKEYDVTSFPYVVIIDPLGKLAYRGWPGSGIIPELERVIEETPPYRTHPREARRARHLLERSREDLRQEDYRRAFQRARKAYRRALTGDRLKTDCQDMIDLAEALGRDEFIQGIQLIGEKSYDEGVAKLRSVAKRFRILKIGKRARRQLEALQESDPEVKRAVERLERDIETRRLLAAAADLLWKRSFGEAYDELKRIVDDFGETAVASDARRILRRMEKNRDIMGYVRDHQARPECEAWLAQARNLAGSGQYEEAKKLLRQIIEKYPDTIYAEKAYQELGKLP